VLAVHIIAKLVPPSQRAYDSFAGRDPLVHFLVGILADPLFSGTFGLLIGLYYFYRGFALLRRKQLILNTPRSTIRAAALGSVEVAGNAAGPYTLISPISKLDCYYYRVVARHFKHRTHAQVVAEEFAPLFVNDGTGNLMIYPRGMEIRLPVLQYLESGSMSDYLRHFLIRHGIATDDLVSVEEFCIQPEDRLFVLGTLQESPWGAGNQGVNPDGPFERIGPGFLTEAEADLQRRAAFEFLDPTAPSGATQVSAPEFDLNPRLILMKGSCPFIISTRSEREVVMELSLRSMLYIWGGPILASVCLWQLLVCLGV
jgi:hypothetical protein